MGLWSHSGLWREGNGLLQVVHRSLADNPAQLDEELVAGPQVALVGPTDPLATGLGALIQGRGPGGLDSLVLEALAPDSPDHGLGGLGGVLGPPSLDFFPACAVQDRGGSLMKGKR